MAQSGGAIFGNLPLLFAIGVAIGLTENDGVAALAGAVGYVVLLAAMGVMARSSRDRDDQPSWASRRSRPASSAASSSGDRRGGCSTASTGSSCRPISASSPASASCRSSPRSPSSSSACAPQLRLAADRQRDQGLLELGGARPARARRHHLRRRRARADSVRPAPRLERAVLLRGGRFARPETGEVVHGEITRFIRRRPDGGQPGRRLPLQDVGPARGGHRDLARGRGRRTARRSAASWSRRR